MVAPVPLALRSSAISCCSASRTLAAAAAAAQSFGTSPSSDAWCSSTKRSKITRSSFTACRSRPTSHVTSSTRPLRSACSVTNGPAGVDGRSPP